MTHSTLVEVVVHPRGRETFTAVCDCGWRSPRCAGERQALLIADGHIARVTK